MFTGNRKTVERDIEAIAGRLRAGRTTLAAEWKRYHCAYGTLRNCLAPLIAPDEWDALRKRNQARGGVKQRYRKGHVPWSKGKTGIRFSPATEFKPGRMRGQAARNYKPVGAITIRKTKRGRKFRMIKINEAVNPAQRWIPVAMCLVTVPIVGYFRDWCQLQNNCVVLFPTEFSTLNDPRPAVGPKSNRAGKLRPSAAPPPHQ